MGSDVQLTSYLQSSSAPDVPNTVAPKPGSPQLPMSPASAALPPSSPAAPPSPPAPPSLPAAPPSSPTVPLHALCSTICTVVPQCESCGPGVAAPGDAQFDVPPPPPLLLVLHATTSPMLAAAIAPRAITIGSME